jgi:uncharacterized protein (DUF433 family)
MRSYRNRLWWLTANESDVGSTPCFRGTRVPFRNLIDYLDGGHSLGDFLRQFPTVTREMAIQSLEEAQESLPARTSLRFWWTNVWLLIFGTAFQFREAHTP